MEQNTPAQPAGYADALAPDVVQWLTGRWGRCPVTGLRQHGASSDALAMHALGMPLRDRLSREVRPYDPSDLVACELTVRKAPERLRPLMQPILDRWRLLVAERYSLDEMDAALAQYDSDGGA